MRKVTNNGGEMKKMNNILTGLMLTGIIALVMSCGSTAPFQERDVAMKSIELAKSVEASKYAPADFSGAEDDYSQGEGLIQPEEKSSQNDEAKEKYISADVRAQEAYRKSVTPFTESFIRRTDEEVEKARQVKADVAQSELFDSGVSKNEQAKGQLGNGDYENARKSSLEAYDSIQMAIAETEAIKKEVDVLKSEYVATIDDLRNNKAEAAIPNEYGETVENFNALEKKYQEGYYDELLEEYPDGILFARDNRVLIEEKRIFALDNLEKAEISLEEAQQKTQAAENNEN